MNRMFNLQAHDGRTHQKRARVDAKGRARADARMAPTRLPIDDGEPTTHKNKSPHTRRCEAKRRKLPPTQKLLSPQHGVSHATLYIQAEALDTGRPCFAHPSFWRAPPFPLHRRCTACPWANLWHRHAATMVRSPQYPRVNHWHHPRSQQFFPN